MSRKRSNRARCRSSSRATSASHVVTAPVQESCKVAEEPHQYVHQQMLVVFRPDDSLRSEGFSKEVMMPVAGGRDQDYNDWWHDQAAGHDHNNLSLLNVRLIGDASSPQHCTHIAYSDLAYCRYGCYYPSVAESACQRLNLTNFDRFVSTASGATTELWSTRQTSQST